MHSRWSFKRKSVWAIIVTPVLAVSGLAAFAVAPAAAAKTPAAHQHALSAAQEHFTVKPNKTENELDCNGWSTKYKAVAPAHRMLCTDPHGGLVSSYSKGWSASPASGGLAHWTRFTDNGHYVGHDEPSVKFISTSPNSGNTMTYYMQLPRDPARAPTANGRVVDYFELSPAPWFGLPMCDPASYPQNPCTPDSDSNLGGINDPRDAGSAFMELQFYPPKETPFLDNISCTATKWCSALTIDSLESEFNFVGLNPACEEPSNFAYLQRNGVPTGPPGPQDSNAATFTPNSETLLMNPGDVLKLSITDPPAGFTTTVTDITTGQTGTMTASAGNGFMNTNYQTCAGSPFTFHAEYNTAAQQNSVPWAALDGGVLMEQETGHNEACNALKNKDPFVVPGVINDEQTYDTCVGGSEGFRHGTPEVGEGGCNANGVCRGAETQGRHGPVACPSDKLSSGDLCEFADAFCFKKGSRTVTLGTTTTEASSPLDFCAANRYQNGDLDFDGISYQRHSWPNGSRNSPTSIRYVGPFDAAGNTYPLAEWETDIPGSEFLCNVGTGADCTAPPISAHFYPFWSLTNKQTLSGGLFPAGTCTWNFGNVVRHVTTVDFGKDAEYGLPELSRYGGTLASSVYSNPETDSSLGCGAITEPTG